METDGENSTRRTRRMTNAICDCVPACLICPNRWKRCNMHVTKAKLFYVGVALTVAIFHRAYHYNSGCHETNDVEFDQPSALRDVDRQVRSEQLTGGQLQTAVASSVNNIREHSYNASRWVPQFDPNGYILFCLCMGNVGNQMDQLLGSLGFAKRLNRTLILPPISPDSLQFSEWFQLKAMLKYHRVLQVDSFMNNIAPIYWPRNKRVGFCKTYPRANEQCNMKHKYETTAFWNSLGVNFYGHVKVDLNLQDSGHRWRKTYPASQYPVLALRGAPGSYPIRPEFRALQRHLVFSDRVQEEANNYIIANFPMETYVGIHLRNAQDWKYACESANGAKKLMSSPQCLEGTNTSVTTDMCFPPADEIVRLTRQIVTSIGAKVVFVGTDNTQMIEKLREGLRELEVTLHVGNKDSPIIDLAILTMSDHFIGNCVSSFTAFVKRARDVAGKPTSFWGFS